MIGCGGHMSTNGISDHQYLSRKNGPLQLELNGFFLNQPISASRNKYGDPIQTGSTRTINWEKYKVGPNAVMVFEYLHGLDLGIFSIELRGKKFESSYFFSGVQIGDDEAKLIRWFGNPDEIMNDEGSNTKLLYTKTNNFMFITDKDKKLISIKIWSTENRDDLRREWGPPIINPPHSHWNSFKGAVVGRSADHLIFRFRPDAKIYIGGILHTFNLPLRDIFTNEDNILRKIFLSSDGCVYQEIINIRPYKVKKSYKGSRVIYTHTFPKSSCLSKIRFSPYYGYFRVSEIYLKTDIL